MVKEENLVKRPILQVFQAVVDFLMHCLGSTEKMVNPLPGWQIVE